MGIKYKVDFDIVSDPEKYRRGWTSGLPSTKCGYGSRIDQTKIQRKWIPKVISEYGIASVADIGAGDLLWIDTIELGCDYKAYDLVPRHPSVIEFDLLTDEIPKADCLMVIWVLNHLPPKMARIATEKLLNSGAKYLMYTYEPRMWDFTDLEAVESVVIRHRSDERGNVELRLVEL